MLLHRQRSHRGRGGIRTVIPASHVRSSRASGSGYIDVATIFRLGNDTTRGKLPGVHGGAIGTTRADENRTANLMNDKEWKLECPCCHSELRVDSLTGKVVGWLQAGDSAARVPQDATVRWDALTDRVQGRLAQGEDKLERALDKERTRSRDLDDAFDAAKRRSRGEQREPD